MKYPNMWRVQVRIIDGFTCILIDKPNKSRGRILRISRKNFDSLKLMGVKEIKAARFGIYK